MGSKLDLTGQKYGFLTVIEEDFEAEELAVAKGRRKRSVWKCICDCGNTFSVLGESLRSGKTESCGCYRKAKVSETFKKYNSYDLTGEYGIGYDSKGKSFTFDLEDYDLIKDYCWHVAKHYKRKDNGCLTDVRYYVVSNSPSVQSKHTALHRLIMGVVDNPEVCIDHKNGDGCDNRKSNLRICTSLENAWNVKPRKNAISKYKGVTYSKQNRKWIAKIRKCNEVYTLGSFETEEQAALVYNQAAKEMFGEYAWLNDVHFDNEINTITD